MQNVKLFSSRFSTGSTASVSNEKVRRKNKKVSITNRVVRKPNHENFEARILIIDDDQFSRTLVGAPLIQENFEVTLASTLNVAIEEIISNTFDFIILDWVLAEATGFDVLKKAEELMVDRDNNKRIPFVIYSTCTQIDIRLPDLKLFEYKGHWLKPFNAKKIKEKILEIKKG